MPSIILVEDDPMIGEIYQRKFGSSGFDVTIATSGKEFLNEAGKKKYDLVLLDMVLPEMSGLDILTELKKSGKYDPELKVFIFSNLTSKEDYDKAMANGADGYIPKTRFNPSELVDEVKRIINEIGEQKKNENRRNAKDLDENGSNISKNGKRVLFIEDEKAFVEIFCKKLRDEGYEVESAENGAWGLKEAFKKDFDLIVTDMMMPAMTGPEIIAKLRMEEKTKNIPIIVISASSTDEKIREVKELGISDFFIKTRIVPSDLARRVDEILK
ncbi:MAG: response regulator [Parcubacteria group bacterium]|jgi:DNA-binding response OmpR family regulator